MKKVRFSVALVAVALNLGLTSCGGGGGNTSNAGSESIQTPTDTGSISATFSPGSSPRYTLIYRKTGGVYGISFGGPAAPLTQSSTGAITALGSFALSGTGSATYDVAGDTDFALGRWTYGTVTESGSTVATLNGEGFNGWHYLVFNPLSALPAGTFSTTCDSGTFTTPTYLQGNSSAPMTAATTGSTTLSFTGGVAGIDISLTTTSGSISNTIAFGTLSVTSVDSVYVSGSIQNDNGALVRLAEGSGGTYRIVGVYSTVLSNGAMYQGAFTFKCAP